jgi:hypothetical protein
MLNDSSNEPRFKVTDHSNGAPGGEEAHGNFIDCMMKTIETSASSAVKDQAAGVGHGVRNQLEVLVGNEAKAPEKVAEVKPPKGDGADLSNEALAFTMNDEAKRAAAGRGQQTLVFDNSIYPPTSATAAADADKWLDERVNTKKAA